MTTTLDTKPFRFYKMLIPSIFLTVFCLPVISTYFLFKIRQFEIHTTIAQLIQGSTNPPLTLLKISKQTEKNLELFERTDLMEFKYQGNMYDVVKQELHGSTTWYWCIWDKEESELEINFAKINTRSNLLNPNGKKHATQIEDTLDQFLQTLFFYPTSSKTTSWYTWILNSFLYTIQFVSQWEERPLTPPPDSSIFYHLMMP